MSTLVMSACWNLQMPPTPKAVLISLADNANDHGECWPSIPTISMRTCFSERAVHGAIKWLEEHGLVTADRTNGRHTLYVVSPDGFQPPQEMHPRSSCGGAADAAEPPQEMRSPPQIPQSPPQQLRSNRKEPSRTVSKATVSKRVTAPTLPCPDDVDPQTWGDWLTLRKAKRAPVTETVVRDARREAAKAGLALTRFLEIWCSRGSQGLQADWLKPNERGSPPGQAPAQPASKTRSAIEVLQGMKHANRNRVDPRRDSGRPEQAALPQPGSHAGYGPDSGDSHGVG